MRINCLDEKLGCADRYRWKDKSTRYWLSPEDSGEIKVWKKFVRMMGPATPQQVTQEPQRRVLSKKTFIAPSVCVCVRSLSVSLDVSRLLEEVTSRWQGSNNPRVIRFNLTPLRHTLSYWPPHTHASNCYENTDTHTLNFWGTNKCVQGTSIPCTGVLSS